MRSAIGIDLGCTNIKAVLINENGTILHQVRQETREQDDQYWKSSVNNIIRQLRALRKTGVASIGLCAPGLANAANTFIECMPGRLPGLEKRFESFLQAA